MATKKKARCFMCDTVLAPTHMPEQGGIPATCLRCGGRLHGIAAQAATRAAEAERERILEWLVSRADRLRETGEIEGACDVKGAAFDLRHDREP